MGYQSPADFVTLHALRIKGFATVPTLCEIVVLDESVVTGHLRDLESSGHAQFREARSLWQLTPAGRAHHADRLRDDMAAAGLADRLAEHYHQFLHINTRFKELCGDWQLRHGAPNDHSDAAYDREVIGRLEALDTEVAPIVVAYGEAFDRFAPYRPRLDAVRARVVAGEINLFTGVMCGSYHDVWMELHEDLILSQGIDRAAEGSA
jgi:hypothetical protein